MAKRAKALYDFQHDPPTTVFLLSMRYEIHTGICMNSSNTPVKDTHHSFVPLFLNRAGAVGINLTQANRVFLMEPSFNPALEAQAIGRVHRLGQKRNVEIVRFVMKDSVESRILTMLKKKHGGSMASNHDDCNKKPEVASLVGSIHTDRTAVVAEEFDILFGIAGSPLASSEVEAEVEEKADAVLSL